MDNKTKGRKNRQKGKEFERKIREDLEKKGWIVIRWDKNIDLINKKLINSKPKFNPFTKSLIMNSGGFPDFLCIKFKTNGYGIQCLPKGKWNMNITPIFDIRLVECKINGYLTPEEREKCKWIKINLKIPIVIASKNKKEIKYEEFKLNEEIG
jgi:hypothetical protein